MLIHVTTIAGWERLLAERWLHANPFLHLCTGTQIAFVLERHFAGQAGLVLLQVDPAGLDIRWEDSEPGMPPFPHLYGPLPLGSVTRLP